MIKIDIENVLVRGEKRIKVVKVEMLQYDQLPTRYTVGGCVLLDETRIAHREAVGKDMDWNWLKSNHKYTEKELETKIKIIRKCGNKLQAVNTLLAKENKGWEGKETIVI